MLKLLLESLEYVVTSKPYTTTCRSAPLHLHDKHTKNILKHGSHLYAWHGISSSMPSVTRFLYRSATALLEPYGGRPKEKNS